MTAPQPQPTPQQQPPPPPSGTAHTPPAWTKPAQTDSTAGQAERPPESTTTGRHDGDAADRQQHAGGKVMHLHTAHPRVPIPYVTPGDMFTGARSAASWLPSPRKLAFYGVLGGMAALEVLEWPIAVAIGAATEVITREQTQRQRAEQEQRGQPAAETPARAEPGRPPQAAMG
ncbi:hypothetical protein ACFW2D_36415 [Streptomyces sp. NPDC058914]|uniref:hypothetical protein n=1 Tax=Streptomyces TaxID=1883 RepID=UPI0036A94C0D